MWKNLFLQWLLYNGKFTTSVGIFGNCFTISNIKYFTDFNNMSKKYIMSKKIECKITSEKINTKRFPQLLCGDNRARTQLNMYINCDFSSPLGDPWSKEWLARFSYKVKTQVLSLLRGVSFRKNIMLFYFKTMIAVMYTRQ